jgi:poly(ADP-ribose) glycohydrolase
LFHADFANKFLGGGVLHGGCAQEEMLFVYKPECLAAQLFCEVMLPTESITITGAERYSKYRGYGYSFKYNGNFVDETPTIDSLGALRNHIGMWRRKSQECSLHSQPW